MSEVFGIDVSHYQGDIDWKKVASDNKRFAILKCQYEAQSHRKDECFEANYKGAGENGLSRGVYIYIARSSMANPQKDAESLLNHLNGRHLEYGIWLDLEDETVEAKGKEYIKVLAFLYAKIFKEAGYFFGIYCNKDWYGRLIHEDLKKNFDFWIARYPSNDTGIYNAQSSLKPIDYGVAWQYSSKGRVNGIKGNVDLDVDFDGIINLAAKDTCLNPYELSADILKKGDRGDSVKWLQFQLNKNGAALIIDGIFGVKTEAAVISYKESKGLLGIAGSETINSIK